MQKFTTQRSYYSRKKKICDQEYNCKYTMKNPMLMLIHKRIR